MQLSEFGKSGNAALDKFIFEKSLKWIPYKKLDNVEYLDKGGFGTIYKATWLDNYTARNVVLKCSNILNENLDEFLNEWKYHEKCLKSLEIINLHGFTKNPEKGYMVVMDYANEGNLRGNLSKIVKNDWREKLYILYKIISGLNEIHEQNLIHCDFHDGDIHGVIPFMAPEILRGKSYTRTSDIYSFAMIMWEFTSGIPPFSDRAHNFQLVISICEGERPKILQSTPQCYINLMKRCWHENLSIRPSASDVKDTIKKWIFYPNDDKIEKKFISNIMEFINAPIEHNDLTTKIHPQAYYTSRLHNFTSEQLNKTLESKRLDRIKYGNLESNDLLIMKSFDTKIY
ncbi:kinase-like domain-containing protein [Rhizophagus clarus]|uniref:Kinase-like domain-containing protein n=1 Tax=Rhizophagus clarus TaxID=94130 RepID=A0A8H3L677_9GLOM|nr:kinase-like domain-containing protein [Rhizophagus clarus]